MAPPNRAIRTFLDSLPSNMMVIFIYDKEDKIIGFAIVDREDKTKAHIYDLNGQELSEMLTQMDVKEVVNTLLNEHASYIA
jgi:hypothetical protein